MTNPIKPVTETRQNISARSGQVEEIRQTAGLEFNPATSSERQPINTVANPPSPTEIVEDASVGDNRLSYQGLQVIFLNGKYQDLELDLGTDIIRVSQSQTANWSEKDGQKMRVGINFNNISPRTISFTVDLYHPNQDIVPLAENIAHLQEISPETNEPPLVMIVMGKTKYQQAVCTEYKCDYEAPLPSMGGYRRAKINLSFKIAGGAGNIYQFAPSFSEETKLQRLIQEEKEQNLEQPGVTSAASLILSTCLSEAENQEFSNALTGDRLNKPETYLTMSSELFMQLAASGLPNNILSDGGFQARLRRELAEAIAKQEGSSSFTHEQIAEALAKGQILAGYNDFEALTVRYLNVYNAIINNSINELDQENSETLTSVAKCGRSLRDSGSLKLVAETNNTQDTAFTVANINNLIKNAKVDELRDYFGMGRNVSNQTIENIKAHKHVETKEEFINLVALSTDGLYGYTAWSSFEQKEQQTLDDLNSFLSSTNDVNEIKSRLKTNNNVASALVDKSFTSKEEFLQTVYSVKKPNGT